MADRPQTLGEEIANSVSHGCGCLLAVAAAPLLMAAALESRRGGNLAGVTIFAVTMILLYLSSALYHAIPHPRLKGIWAKLDHGAIFLFIAGSYTPFALGTLGGVWGWTLLAVIWGLAAVGVGLKAYDRLSHPGWSTGLYLVMGWLVVIAAVPLMQRLSLPGVAWLLAGGVAYTAGVAFYLTDARVKFGHFVWHLFVMAGSTCHFFAVLWYAA